MQRRCRLELNGLKNLLHEKLSQKRCLLVLDDIWNESFDKWDQLRILLMVVGKESKIEVTTRNYKVASIMGIDSPFVLRRGNEGSCSDDEPFFRNPFNLGKLLSWSI